MTYKVWDHKKEFNNITLQGESISARWSGFWIPEFQVMFDAGICSPFHPLHIFITHSHSDHSYQLSLILTAINTKPFVYVPKGTVNLYKQLLLAKHQLSRCDPNAVLNIDDICTFVEVSDNDSIPIVVKGNQPMVVKVFATEHKVPSVGYALFYFRSKLRPEFASLTGKELAQKRKEGVSLNHNVETPCVAYVGDSTPIWLSHPLFVANDFPTVLCECTFISQLEADPQRAIDSACEHGHTDWSILAPVIEKKIANGSKTTFVLTHWSDRYDTKDIELFFKDKQNVIAWLN